MRRPGFALIAVFWIVMVVGLFTAIVASRTGFDIDRSRWALDMGRVRAAADGAVEEAAFRMVERLGSGQPVTDLAGVQELDLRIDDIPVHVTIQDEDGKIDLNGAQPELLALLFEALARDNPDLPVGDPVALSERIADFRDIDNLRRPNGAEDPEYAAAGLAAGAKDSVFDTVGELEQVLGMTPELAAAAAPFLTVHSGRAQFDPVVSPPGLQRLGSAVEAAGLLSGMAPSRRRMFSVTAEAALPGGIRLTRAASFRITGDMRQPVAWYGWRSMDG
ncbi:general secretion pathway protein GspK [Skermanella sp. TT6]|uniref:General secretion pathway protein GspK n=1 Tax=Skermanella cutis TaxID=2775420 RepID=A0ABX7BBG9_9PROT|nr:type II secretion system protein GspK [Skermanella sp. TT6]QQP91734.1 general secretion pathway protein GspK [Skermanella sp. TT6]